MTVQEAQFWLCVAAIACKSDGDTSGFDHVIDALECVSDLDKRSEKRVAIKLLYASIQLGENNRRDAERILRVLCFVAAVLRAVDEGRRSR